MDAVLQHLPPELLQGQMWSLWVLPVLLGLGLAASTGLKTFLPLLMLGLSVRFGLFGIELNDKFDWIVSNAALGALGVATIAEFLGDKIPVVDNALSAIGTFSRPVAAAIAAGAVFAGLDPSTAAIAGIIVGAPTALAFHSAQAGTRVASTAGTAGIANPVISFIEDVLAFGMVVLAFLAPVLIPVVILILLPLILWLLTRVKRAVMGLRRPKSQEARLGA